MSELNAPTLMSDTPAPDPVAAGDTKGTPEVTPDAAPPAEGDAAPPAEGDPAPEADPAPAAEEAGEDPAPEGAPEEYADFTFAENTQIDEAAVAELKTVAKELNLTQDQAQKFAGLADQMAQRWAEGLNNHIIETRTAWRDAVASDKELGGEKMAENLSLAKAAVKDFGSPELMKVLDDTGLGDNPEFIRFAMRVGKANSEHDFVKSGKPATEVSFYDHPTSKPKG